MAVNNGSQQSMKAMTIGDPEDPSTLSREQASRCTCWQKFVTTTDCVNHVLIGFLTALTLFYSARSLGTLDLHITLCSIGYILLMSEGIICLAGKGLITGLISRRARSHMHWVLQGLGLVCVIAGVVVMYMVKKYHSFSNHANLGIVSLVIMMFLAVFGYPVFVAAKLRKLVRPVTIKFTHNLLGIVCFVLGMAAQILGYQMHWLPRVSSVPHLQVVAVVFTAIIIILTVRNALPNLISQLAAIFNMDTGDFILMVCTAWADLHTCGYHCTTFEDQR